MTEAEKRGLARALARDILSDTDYLSVVEWVPEDVSDIDAEDIHDMILSAEVVIP